MEKTQANWKQVFEIDPVAVHTLWKGWKHFKDIGHLTVYEKEDGTYWGNINHGFKYEIFKDSVFYKLVYKSFTSYLKESLKGGFIVLSFENQSPKLGQWEEFVKKFGTIEDYGKALQSAQLKKKIDFHCPNIEKTSVHSNNFLTPFFKWGGRVQDTVLGKSQEVLQGASQNQGYAQKTKRLIRNSWKAFRTKVHDAKQVVSEKLHLKKADQNVEQSSKNVLQVPVSTA